MKSAAIVGPTASGKTTLSLAVAERVPVEIVSMDSRQIYRGLDIGTAKATRSERDFVPHHGLDLVDPDERFSAGRFARYVRDLLPHVQERGRVPLLVGGTGFFLHALTNPIFREPPMDATRRRKLQSFLETLPDDELLSWLHSLDPELAGRLEQGGGRQRILRGLELPLLTGHSLTWWHQHAPPEAEPIRPIIFVVDRPREELYERINRRVDVMLENGLVDEVRTLLDAGYDARSPGLNATGYAELIPVLKGERSLEDAAELIRKNTRAYARRQLTWFRNKLPDGAIWLDGTRPTAELAVEVADRINLEIKSI